MYANATSVDSLVTSYSKYCQIQGNVHMVSQTKNTFAEANFDP